MSRYPMVLRSVGIRGVVRMLALTLLGGFASTGFAWAGFAWAGEADKADSDEPRDTLAVLTAEFKAAKKAHDEAKASQLAPRIAATYEQVVDDKQRKALVALVTKLPTIKKSDVVVSAALQAVATMGDRRGAKFIKKYLRQRNKKQAGETLKVALSAAGKLPDRSLVGPLLGLFDKTKLISVKRMTAQALSRYGSLKRHRGKILEALVSALKKVKPGGPGRMSGGGGGGDGPSAGPGAGGGELGAGSGGYGDYGGPAEIWTALSAIMPGLLNRLTGQKVGSVDVWFGLFDSNKRNLDALFQD